VLATQQVEPRSMCVEQRGIVFEPHVDPEAALEPYVEVDQVRIDIVDERTFGSQSQRNR
jgi:hypothetical protein